MAVVHRMGNQHAEVQRLAEQTLALLSNQDETAEVLLSRGAAYALLADCASVTKSRSRAEMARLSLDSLERVIAESSDSDTLTSAYMWAARVYTFLGNSQKTMMLCEKCLQHELDERERLECQMTLIEALRSQNRLADAERVIENAREYVGTNKQYSSMDKKFAQMLELEQGLVQRLSNRFSEASATFRRLVTEAEADHASQKGSRFLGIIWWNLAAVLYESCDYRGARTAFEKALAYYSPNEPDHYKILLSLGDSYLGTAAHAKAQDYYDKVLASVSSEEAQKLGAHVGIAKIQYESGGYERASASFETLLSAYSQDDPSFFGLLLWLGGCYEGMWLKDKARHCYEDVLAASCSWEADRASAQQALERLSLADGTQTFS